MLNKQNGKNPAATLFLEAQQVAKVSVYRKTRFSVGTDEIRMKAKLQVTAQSQLCNKA
ncbi:hypothetical protein [Legionella saoudiensis]|uniref:hypothetical protein n=1 Tax=Legionella saoudiensis TaxID=1750561 RepID=UPI0012D8421E|nr:hypothetical protein [Legionella saoudiensis]